MTKVKAVFAKAVAIVKAHPIAGFIVGFILGVIV